MSREAEPLLLADDELLIERWFRAPAALLFRLWEKPEHLSRWLGPESFTCTHVEIDFRPGGRWRACITAPDRGDNWMGGIYRQIERPRLIAFTFAWEKDGCAPPDFETLVTITFHEEGERTLQRFHQKGFPTAELRDSHVGGWSSAFTKEIQYAEALALKENRP